MSGTPLLLRGATAMASLTGTATLANAIMATGAIHAATSAQEVRHLRAAAARQMEAAPAMASQANAFAGASMRRQAADLFALHLTADATCTILLQSKMLPSATQNRLRKKVILCSCASKILMANATLAGCL